MNDPRSAPVIAIDGPSASGKGTVAQQLAQQLGFHYLDSGALYRGVALAALRAGVDLVDEAALARLAGIAGLRFEHSNVYLDQEVITDTIRQEAVGEAASRVAALPAVRSALLAAQRAFRKPPGLVADGRDMGSTVFPDAVLKIYLTADPAERARRRYKQLIDKGLSATMTALLQDIKSRDERDSARAIAPLQKGDDAIVLDTTDLTVGAAVAQLQSRYLATVAPH